VKGGGGLVLLVVDELLEGGLLLGAALEDEDDAAERGRAGEGSLVKLRAGEGVGVAGEGGDAGIVDGLEDAGTGSGRLGLRGRRSGGGEEENESRQTRQQRFRERSRDPRHWFDSCCSRKEEMFLAGKLRHLQQA
jgi:hypothetical protein